MPASNLITLNKPWIIVLILIIQILPGIMFYQFLFTRFILNFKNALKTN